MDLAHGLNGVVGLAAAAFGLYVIATQRFTLGENEADVQVWLYGWRAVVAGCASLAVAALFFAAALNFVHIDLTSGPWP
jgi:hypothetical protein